MNPRLFCRDGSYHHALLLTYSFDPIFFEQVVLPDLWAGRSSDILVLGDRSQIEASTQAAAGQLWHLGRHYLLAGANHPGSFHPKVFLRVGPKDGRVMLGSGNVTSSGWGGNQELGAEWMVGPDHADKGGWLHSFLDSVSSWCGGELELDAVRRIKDVSWLSEATATPDLTSAVVHSRRGLSLASALAQRWAGRKFDDVKIFTGSTDESGAFLRWAHSTFGVKRATVALTPSSASFVPGQLADLLLELRIVPAPTSRPMHAKLYWFDGPDGPAAVMGSANCSAAAWLLTPEHGGNVETLLAYDQPDPSAFEGVLRMFEGSARDPRDIGWRQPIAAAYADANAKAFRLKALLWDGDSRRLHAEICPLPEVDMESYLLLGGIRLPMQRAQSDSRYWECELPQALAKATAFAFVEISRGVEQWKTRPMWVNDVAALDRASRSSRLLEPFKSLERGATSAEQRQMLDDLRDVAHALFSDTTELRDPKFGYAVGEKPKTDKLPAPVNPTDLIVQLAAPQDVLSSLVSHGPGSLSLTGILRMLFDAEEQGSEGLAASGDEDLDEDTSTTDPNRTSKKRTQKAEESANATPIEDRFRQKLALQIATFLSQISSSDFEERCSATQLVQAIAFPLAVALRGQGQGWVSQEVAQQWALKVFSILFHDRGPEMGGLLHAVEKRYARNDQQSTFAHIVGDGTLWMVLVATLGNANWHGIGNDIDKAVALRAVFNAPQLLASAQPGRIAALLGKIRIDDSKSYVAEVAPTVTRLLGEIESLLVPLWDSEMRDQAGRSVGHKPGDLLWRDHVGWAVCLAAWDAGCDLPIEVRLSGLAKQLRAGYYVNVSELSARNIELGRLLQKLRSSVSRT